MDTQKKNEKKQKFGNKINIYEYIARERWIQIRSVPRFFS